MLPARRFISWLVIGASAWLTFRPNSRPRRVARRLLTDLAVWIVVHPKLGDFLRRVLARFPRLEARLRAGFRNERALRLHYIPETLSVRSATIGEPDLTGELEGVRDLYRCLVSLRQQLPKETPGL